MKHDKDGKGYFSLTKRDTPNFCKEACAPGAWTGERKAV